MNIIAPTKEARELGNELCESEIYGKGDIDNFKNIGYIIDKIRYGLIAKDTITLHNLVAEKSGDRECISGNLNYKVIDKIINDERFFDEIDRYNFSNIGKNKRYILLNEVYKLG